MSLVGGTLRRVSPLAYMASDHASMFMRRTITHASSMVPDSHQGHRWFRRFVAGNVVTLLAATSACEPPRPGPTLDLPPRPADAATGGELAHDLASLDVAAREERILQEVSNGNVPTWLLELRPVALTRELEGRSYEVVFWVTSDYLAVGSDEDYLLVPLSPQGAQRIADRLAASLPTPLMVDAVWVAADARLAPQRLAPQDSVGSVRTVEYFARHTSVIDGQRMLRRVARDALVAGHKKDVVLSPVLGANPGKVAVYGMHQTDGTPTQRLSTVAQASWVYYNHGVRLVHRRITVDGADLDIVSVLRDPRLARLLSDAGVIAEPRYPTSVDSGGSD
jgi:hypothetical protein